MYLQKLLFHCSVLGLGIKSFSEASSYFNVQQEKKIIIWRQWFLKLDA